MAMVEEPWANSLLIALIVIASIALVVFIIIRIIDNRCHATYEKLLQEPATPLDVDTLVGEDNKASCAKVALLHRFNVGWRDPSEEPIPLTSVDSPHVEGLKLTKAHLKAMSASSGESGESSDKMSKELLKTPSFTEEESLKLDTDKGVIVVGTIRMGFGHHRIAYSTASWALNSDNATYFHDFLGIESVEAELIKSTDQLYSKGSRIASDMGGFVEKLWGKSMLSGDADALRAAALFSVHLRPLLNGIKDKSTPIIATHQIVGLTAVAAGFTNVINLVIDNHPQWFLVVPGALNLVQGPVNYQAFRSMGVSTEELRLAGHWCPHQIVSNIPADSQRRIDRAKAKKPVRFLIPVGGAGAQRKFILKFLEALAPLVKAHEIQIFLNAGDHKHMHKAFLDLFGELHLDYDLIDTIRKVRDFQTKLIDGGEPTQSITLFSFEDYFPAVATTDILCRVTDVLSSKPSELAFYPVPKLNIRRVGDHEADSARRSSELGDGTVEVREVPMAMHYIQMMMDDPDFLIQMNKSIVENNKIGIYDGCKNAVEIAMGMAKKNKNV